MKTTMERVYEHLYEAKQHFAENHIVGIWLQGSQNYELDLPTSDVDTKLIVTPTFKDIALATKPVSTTHIRENNEHIDAKDIRNYISCFHKQNLNFLEILFTPYNWVNPMYESEWSRLIRCREQIARMNPYRAVKSMKGVAMEKYYAMEHRYPSKIEILDKYGYDGKQTHHLLRIEDFLERYIAGEDYEKCLIPTLSKQNHLLDYKKQLIPLTEACEEAQKALEHINYIADHFCNITEDKESSEMRELLEDVSYNIMKISVMEELKECIVH